MEIKYDIRNNYLKYYNEVYGIAMIKNKLKKNKNKKLRTYSTNVTIAFILAVLIEIIVNLVCSILKIQIPTKFLTDILKIFIECYIISIGVFFIFIFSKYNTKKGKIEIRPSGILDSSETGIKLEISYNLIELVLITKNLIVFITDTPFIMFVKNKNKEKIIEEIRKYSDVLIIDKTE